MRAHLDGEVTLAAAAAAAGVPIRTARRWLAAYRANGPAGLKPAKRADRGHRRTSVDLVALIEGLALRRPPPSLADIHRQVSLVAAEGGGVPPSYNTVRAVVRAMDGGLVTMAHRGAVAYRDRYELVYRREAARPNEVWQADHTELDVLVLDQAGNPARPWLTVVLDDHVRAVAGYTVFLGAPTALQTALALRQAIWRKSDPAWAVCGVPDVLYSDHGSDFTSDHLAQVCHYLRIQLVHSTAGVPQGRGKIERFFGTVTTELLPTLPGHIPHGTFGKPVTRPALSLADLDHTMGRFFVHDYHQRRHSETGRPRRSGGPPAAGCPASPTHSSNWTCCCSPSPGPGSCTATACTATACATSTSPWPPTSGSPWRSATTPATSPKSASTTKAATCAGR